MIFDCLEKRNGIDSRIVKFCMPLASTINMNGAALYETVAAIFIAQYRGIDLDIIKLIIICVSANVASISTIGIPKVN